MLNKKSQEKSLIHFKRKKDTVLYCLTLHLHTSMALVQQSWGAESTWHLSHVCISNRSVLWDTEAHLPCARAWLEVPSWGDLWDLRCAAECCRRSPEGRLCARLMPLVISHRATANASSPPQHFAPCHSHEPPACKTQHLWRQPCNNQCKTQR